MRILFLHTGRIEERKANVVQALQMSAAFAALGHETTLAVNSYTLRPDAVRAKVEEELGAVPAFAVKPFRGHTMMGLFKSFGCAGPMRQLIATIPHDLCFCRDASLFPLIAHARTRFVFEAHNTVAVPNGGAIDYLWKRRIAQSARSNRVSLFVTISRALGRWWNEHGVPEKKICPLHSGTNPDRFLPDTEPAAQRKALGLPEGNTVLYAGSLRDDRNIPTIFQLSRFFKETHFVIVGGSPDEQRQQEERAKAEGCTNVHFVGSVPNAAIPAYLAAADVLLMLWSRDVPTIDYCSPMKVFEYMAAARTIVGHGFPTIREVLTDGVNALLADPESFDDLRDKLTLALEDPTGDMPAAARALVVSDYSLAGRCRTIVERINNRARTGSR